MGWIFFVLALGALFYSLSQKAEEKARREHIETLQRQVNRNSMGHGRDNIYQFKIYCYNMRALLTLAQNDGIGVGRERDESYYDDFRDEISSKYCGGEDPICWCMFKAADAVIDKRYINAWEYNKYGTEYSDEHDLARGIYTKRIKDKGTWKAYKSEYDRFSTINCIEGIHLPKDGKTGADLLLRRLHSLNHEFERDGISFNESGITLEDMPLVAPEKSSHKLSNAYKSCSTPDFDVCNNLSDEKFNFMIQYCSSDIIKEWMDYQELNHRNIDKNPRYIEACIAYLEKKDAEKIEY